MAGKLSCVPPSRNQSATAKKYIAHLHQHAGFEKSFLTFSFCLFVEEFTQAVSHLKQFFWIGHGKYNYNLLFLCRILHALQRLSR